MGQIGRSGLAYNFPILFKCREAKSQGRQTKGIAQINKHRGDKTPKNI